MRIKNISEPQKFFKEVRDCKGSVELITTEGDRLNLKSKLCQYITLTQMFKDESMHVELIVSDPEDMKRLAEYLVKD